MNNLCIRPACFALSCSLVILSGCSTHNGYVIAATGTVIGVEVSQSPASAGTPQAKLGYNRAEFAYVPTNRRATGESGEVTTGAESSAEVLMELKYSGIFSFGENNGIYQRLAVGRSAVTANGAALMFMRDNSGTVPTPDAVKKATEAAAAFDASKPPPAKDATPNSTTP